LSAVQQSPGYRTGRSGAPRAAVFAWLVIAAGGVGLGWWFVQFWGTKGAAVDRLLIPLAALWLLSRQAGALRHIPPSPSPAGLLPLAGAALLVPPAWYLYAQVGPLPLLLYWLTAAWLAAVCGLVLIGYGRDHLRAIAFPLLFLLFALPLPQRIQNALQGHLQEATTTFAAAALPRLGIPAERSGFVLRLTTGELGVVEACSGVRSVTAIIAVAALLAYLRGFGVVRGVVLVLLALPVIALANAVRVVLSGLLQESLGLWVNQGAAHEALGAVTLLVGLAGVLTLSHGLRPRETRITGAEYRVSGEEPRFLSPDTRYSRAVAAGLLGLALMGSVAAVGLARQVEVGAEPAAPLDTLARTIGAWDGEDVPIDPVVLTTLGGDNVVHRVYRNPAGQQVHVWAIHWSSASAIKDYIHHPDVCWPNQGWSVVGEDRRPVPLSPPASLSMTVRYFERGGRRQVIGYWIQDGARVWTDQEERRAVSGWPSQRWALDRLLSRAPQRRTPRLVALVGADSWGAAGYAERAVEEFAGQFATELYRICPWALPVADGGGAGADGK
jgi:EpsI family protein